MINKNKKILILQCQWFIKQKVMVEVENQCLIKLCNKINNKVNSNNLIIFLSSLNKLFKNIRKNLFIEI